MLSIPMQQTTLLTVAQTTLPPLNALDENIIVTSTPLHAFRPSNLLQFTLDKYYKSI